MLDERTVRCRREGVTAGVLHAAPARRLPGLLFLPLRAQGNVAVYAELWSLWSDGRGRWGALGLLRIRWTPSASTPDRESCRETGVY